MPDRSSQFWVVTEHDRKLKALISLLDDPDEQVFRHIVDELVEYGPEAVPILECEYFNTHPDPIAQERISNIIHRIEFSQCLTGVKEWANDPKQGLLTGALSVARYQYPELDQKPIRQFIERLTRDVWLELNDNLTALEQVRVMNHIFFEVYHFNPNSIDFHAPQNSFLNAVVESKKGNPLSLAILYLEVARNLGIQLCPINLPELFVLGYKDLPNPDPAAMLFYVNPFGRGSIFGFEEMLAFIRRTGFEPEPSLYTPCTDLEIIERMTNNLLNSYNRLNDQARVAEIKQMQSVLAPFKSKF